MSVNKILERLETHRKTSENQWVAVCPAHSDRSPSLHVKEKEDGRILIHCKAGCGANEVLDALGLNYSDLFPDTGETYKAFKRVGRDVLDDYVIEIWNADRKLGRAVSREDKERYRQALMNGGKPNGFIDELLDQTK
ncbi:CHC2 zinc finger domain-containing protein [bacterium]|nr:CHC2 zinc finger domain-containing protein [bacterium]